MLDFASGQAKRLESRVGRRDRDRLDQYFTSIREVEEQLERNTAWSLRPKPEKVAAVDPLADEKTPGEADLHVIRGGSWYNAPVFCRSAMREFFDATDAAAYVGFRIVREE